MRETSEIEREVTWPKAHVGGAQEGLASVWYQVIFFAVEADTRAPSTSGMAMAITCAEEKI